LANHKSAAKRAKQSNIKSERNSSVRNAVRTWEKKLRKAVSDKDQKLAQDLLKSFMSKIDKAAKKSIFHSATASRKIARVSKYVHEAFAK